MTALAEVHDIDPAKREAFIGKALGNMSGAMATIMAAIGDRLGLFKSLAQHGPSTAAQLAARTRVSERYAREWLGGMTSSGYIEYCPKSGTFALPPEHAPVLTEEHGPVFFGGVHQEFLGALPLIDQVVDSFRTGRGVPQNAFNENFWEGLERFTASWFENFLVQQWIPSMPDVEAKLQNGACVVDVGCGRGRALIRLAEAYPKSFYTGFDSYGPSVDRARANAKNAGVDDRVRFEVLDAAKGIPEQHDVIFTFDVVHDAVDPVGMLRSIRQALRPDGVYACLDINCSDKLEENAGPLGALFHGFSLLYCLTTSLAEDGAGLGTLGLNEPKLCELASVSGFTTVRRVPLDNPFNNLYELRP